MKLFIIIFTLFCHPILVLAQSQDVIHQIGEYQLTMDHMNTYLMMSMLDKTITDEPSEDEINQLGRELILIFKEDPEEVLELLEDFELQLSDLNTQVIHHTRPSTVDESTQTGTLQSLVSGHAIIRDILGSDIGQMNFQSEGANSLRAYLYNSLLSSTSSHADSGSTGSHYGESKTRIQFCSDGTFVQVNSGYLNLSTEGVDMSSTGGDDIMRGYWDVSTLPNGMHFILFYSTDQAMLEDSPNGFLPFPVSSFNEEYVMMPNGDGYQRTISINCIAN